MKIIWLPELFVIYLCKISYNKLIIKLKQVTQNGFKCNLCEIGKTPI